MILRDDHIADWDAAADDTLERRVYYVQNWRADVIALLADNGRVLERIWYEPYGTPHGSPAADWTLSNTSGNDDFGVLDGDTDANDQGYFDTLHAASSARADLTGSTTKTDAAYGRPDGTVDGDDDTYYTSIKGAAEDLSRGVLSGSAFSTSLRNRKGLAGYEWDPSTSKYHVRARVLDPETGRWTSRDPLEYAFGMNMYSYVQGAALFMLDPSGLGDCPLQTRAFAFDKSRCAGLNIRTLAPFRNTPTAQRRFRGGRNRMITITYAIHPRQSNRRFITEARGFTSVMTRSNRLLELTSARASLSATVRCGYPDAFPELTRGGGGHSQDSSATSWVTVTVSTSFTERNLIACRTVPLFDNSVNLLEVFTEPVVKFTFRRSVTTTISGSVGRRGIIHIGGSSSTTIGPGDSLVYKIPYYFYWYCPCGAFDPDPDSYGG